MKRILLALTLAATVASGAACDNRHGSTKPPKPASEDEKFKTSCRLKGGTPQITHKNGKTARVCVPPAGGWQ